VRRLGVVLAVITSASVAPISAAHATAVQLITNPVQVRGYSLYLQVERASFGGETANVTLFQRRDESSQRYAWNKSEGDLAITWQPNLRGAHVHVRFHGAAVRADMTFRPTGPTVHKPARGCEFSNRWVPGRLTGRLVLAIGQGRFGTIVRDHLSGRLVGAGSYLSCRTYVAPPVGDEAGPEGWFETPKLTVPFRDGQLVVAHSGGLTAAHLYQSKNFGDPLAVGGETASRDIMAWSHRRLFRYSPDWSTAHLTGIRPYFKGRLSFTATDPVVHDPSIDDVREGVVRGHLAIRRASPHGVLITRHVANISTDSP
jgi:hypothetical protein